MPITASVRSTADELRQELCLGDRHVVVVDEPEELGGDDTGASPFELLAGAVAGCVAITLRMYARRKEWELDHFAVEVELERECDRCHITVRLPADLPADQAERLERVARKCPVAKVLDTGLGLHHHFEVVSEA